MSDIVLRQAPRALAVKPEYIPAELRGLPRWVGWKWLEADGRWTKPPIDPKTGRYAKPNDPATWGTFEQACRAYRNGAGLAGIGLAFAGDGLVGVDLDGCRDPQTGGLADWAAEIVRRLSSYTEVSPSGTGVKIFCRGELPAPGTNKPYGWPVEIYQAGRYFTLTGHCLDDAPATVNEAPAALSWLWGRVTGGPPSGSGQNGAAAAPPSVAAGAQPVPALSDAEILALIERSAQSTRFRRLWAGEAGAYASPSQADIALCNMLAFYTGDAAQVERLFRQSGLYRPKWDKTHAADGRTYGQCTVEDALAFVRSKASYAPDFGGVGRKAGKEAHGEGGAAEPPTSPPPADPPGLSDPTPWLPLAQILDACYRAEMGDAELLAALYADRVAYDHAEKAWHVWAGHCWQRDKCGGVDNLPGRVIAAQYLYAAAEVAKTAQGKADQERVDELNKRAFALRNRNRRNNVIDMASTQPGLALSGDEWDRDPWLLAVKNGVLDLRTGELRAGAPGDYLRIQAPTAWQGSDAPAPRWERFLQEVFDGDAELVAFMQRLLGYAMTGLATEHMLPILWGKGRNGKDTLLKALAYTLGPGFADAVPEEVFTDAGRSNGGAAMPHVYKLRGLRLAWASETEEGARLKTGQVKLLTGGGILTARPLYGDLVSWQATHTAFLITNHRPHAPADDYALWQRIALIHFALSFVDEPKEPTERKRAPNLDDVLQAEAPGILAWLVRGCLAWQREGLRPPASVKEATAAYRSDEDTLGLWLSECCLIGEGYSCKAMAAYQAYVQWCEALKVKPMTGTSFGRKMTERFPKEHKSTGWEYAGFGILAEPPPPTL